MTILQRLTAALRSAFGRASKTNALQPTPDVPKLPEPVLQKPRYGVPPGFRKRKNVLRGICGWRRDAHAPASGSHYLHKL